METKANVKKVHIDREDKEMIDIMLRLLCNLTGNQNRKRKAAKSNEKKALNDQIVSKGIFGLNI